MQMSGMSQQQMHSQQMAMMQRMRMQQQGMMQGRPDGMMPNGAGMEMMTGPNGMMMRGPGPGGMPQGMQRGQPGMGGPMMMQSNGMRAGMMGQQGHPSMHPGMHQGMANRPPPPEYGMTSQVTRNTFNNLSLVISGPIGFLGALESRTLCCRASPCPT